jgi:hypothetical protein
LPEEINKFIGNTKNESLRNERRLAYTTLFSALKLFLGIDDATVTKNSDGKPYLIFNPKKYQKNKDLILDETLNQKNEDFYKKTFTDENGLVIESQIYINISHSDGTVAVSISDEREIGVDIQSEISKDKAERLKVRFFDGLEITSDSIGIKYYYCHLTEDEASFEEITLPDVSDLNFTVKWTYAESLMKLYGRGFGEISNLDTLSQYSSTEIKIIPNSPFVVATSIKK